MSETDFEMPSETRAKVRRKLRAWYGKSARDLPWRNTRDPYRIWISEIMLQQTTVAAVVPYFERFSARFPNLQDLADAEEADVLRQWEGLGYYSRARNLRKAARVLVADYGGKFPQTADELQKLPGIGRYTAGAISSFAFDKPAPILEANTVRLYARLLGFDGDPRGAAGQRILWKFAEQIHGRSSPGELNQALMELGGTLCSPKEPACPDCPLHRECRAFADGRVAQIPRPGKKIELTDITEISIAVKNAGKYLLRLREPTERWAGLWDFPRFELSEADLTMSAGKKTSGRLPAPALTPAGRRTVKRNIRELTGIDAELDSLVTEIRHGVTRYRIHLLCFSANYRNGTLPKDGGIRWVSPRDFPNYPLSKTGREFADCLENSD